MLQIYKTTGSDKSPHLQGLFNKEGEIIYKQNYFSLEFFPINVNTAFIGIGLLQKLLQSHRIICFEAVQNVSKLNIASSLNECGWNYICEEWKRSRNPYTNYQSLEPTYWN